MKKTLFFLILILAHCFNLKAQWVISPTSSGGSSNIIRINAINSNVVWALDEGEQVYRTVNGGSNWNRFDLNSKIPNRNIVSFTGVNTTIAWATVQNLTNFPPIAELYKTTDGGNTWIQQPSAYTTNSLLNPNIIYFFDANNGVVINDAYGDYIEIHVTSNGGTSWSKVPAANLPSPSLTNDFVGLHKYFTIGDTIWFAAGGMRIFKSINKGLTWTVTNTGIAPTQYNSFVNNVTFTDMNNGILNSVDIFRKTTDGGLTWTPFIPTGPFHTANISNVPGLLGAYISSQSAYTSNVIAIGSSVSLDYGTTWKNLDVTNYHSAIAFSSPASGWAGAFGYLRKFTGTLLGTKEETLSGANFIISPNPSSGTFNVIPTSSAKPFELEIYDLVGHKILQQKGNSFGKNTLDLSGQKKGVYLLYILSGDKRIIEKIILQ